MRKGGREGRKGRKEGPCLRIGVENHSRVNRTKGSPVKRRGRKEGNEGRKEGRKETKETKE